MRAVPLMMMLLLVTWLAMGQAPAPAPAVSGKLGLIMATRVLAECEEGKAFQADLTGKFEPRQKKMEELSAEIQRLQTEYRQGETTFPNAERQKRGLALQRKQKDLERLNEDLNYEANAEREEGLARLNRHLSQVVRKYGSENQYAAIFDMVTAGALHAGSGVDITNEIVAAYNQQFPVKPETPQ